MKPYSDRVSLYATLGLLTWISIMVDVSAQSCTITPLSPTTLSATGGALVSGTEDVRIQCVCPVTGSQFVRWYNASPEFIVQSDHDRYVAGSPHFIRNNPNGADNDVTLVIPTFTDSYDGTYNCGIRVNRTSFTSPSAAVTLTIACPSLNDPSNGMISCPLGSDGVSDPEDTCTYTCNTGYVLTGSNARTCQSNGSWSNSTPTCTLAQCIITPLNPTTLTAAGGALVSGITDVMIQCVCPVAGNQRVRWYDINTNFVLGSANANYVDGSPYFIRNNPDGGDNNVTLVIPTFNDSYDGTYNCGIRVTDTSFTSPSAAVTLTITIPTSTVTISPSGPIQGAMVGSSQNIQCTVSTVSEVTVMISWMGPGGNIDATNDRVSIGSVTDDGNNMYTRSLQFTYLMEGDEGTYTCNVMILGTSVLQSVNIQTLTIPTPTLIVTAPNTQTVGHSLTLQCEVTTVRGITSRVDIVWSSGGMELERMNDTSSTTMSNSLVYTYSYTISQLSTTDDNRVIQCEVVINASPSVMATDSITLDVTVPTPTVTTSPSGPIQGAMVGSSQSIQCTVNTVSGVKSSSVMISWMGPGGNIDATNGRVSIGSVTDDGNNMYTRSLQFTYLMEGDEGTYTCNVMILGTSVSQSIEIQTLTIPTPTVSVTPPNTQTVGQSLTLQCEVTTVTGITSSVDIVWSNGSTVLRRMNGVSLTTMGSSLVYTEPYTVSLLSEANDGNMVQCEVVINASPSVMATDSITLDVTIPNPSVAISSPNNQTVGQSLTLQCEVTTVTGIISRVDIVWSNGSTVLRRMNGVSLTTMDSSLMYTESYTFSLLSEANDGNMIQCEVVINTSPSVMATDSITLDVTIPNPSVAISSPNTQTVGQSLTLQCEVTTVRGITSRVDIVWSNGSTVLRRMNDVSLTTMDSSLVYTESYTFSILSEASDGNMIRCEVVINASPSVMATDSITLDVTIPTPTVNVTAPNTQIVGQSLTLQCEVTTVRGITSRVDIVWLDIGDGTELNMTGNITLTTMDNSLVYTRSYTISQLSKTDDGRVIQCEVVINTSPSVMATDSTILNVAERFIISVTAPNTQQVGNSLTLDCTVTELVNGSDTLEIVWTNNNNTLRRNNVTSTTSMGSLPVYTDPYTITQLTTSDQGREIQCIANRTDPPVTDSDSIILSVTVPFTVVLSLSNGAMVGRPQTISCTVSTVSGVESSSVMISWMGPGGNIDATNSRVSIGPVTDDGNNIYTRSLQFTYLMEGDEGTYTCNVMILETSGSQSINLEPMLPSVTIVGSPAGTPVSGSTNTFDYPILSSVTLMCMVDPIPVAIVDVSYSWNTTRCYTNNNYNNGIPGCFPYNQTTQSVTDDDVTAEDAGTITCTVTISGSDYTSGPFTLSISGIAITDSSSPMVSDYYSYINADSLIARCITGLGPEGTDNDELGEWYFDGDMIMNGECNESNAVQSNGASISDYVGVIDLLQCGTFSTNMEGIYTCTVMDSLRMEQSVRLGVYFPGRTAPMIGTSSPSTITVPHGSPLNLNCTSQGSPPDTFTWRKDNDPTVLQSTSITAVDHTSTSAVFRADYSIDSVNTSDSGTYTCIVTNPIGSDSATITIEVTVESDAGSSSSSSSSTPVGAIAGAIVGVFALVLVIILFGCVVYRYYGARSKRYEPKKMHRYSLSRSSLSTKDKQSALMTSENDLLQPNTGDIPLETINQQQQVRLKPIPLNEFHSHVKKMHEERDYGFEEEYQSVGSEARASCDIAKLPQNRDKNRYANIFAYDFSRVKLQQREEDETDYINSCYIDGYLKPNAYIASQAPMPETTKDFWQMVWDNKVPAIVMLTKLVEAGKPKCHKYWPDKVGDSLSQSHLTVKLTSLQYFADYETRAMEVTNSLEKGNVPLEVKHYFYTVWPDHGVPQFATSIIGFIRKVGQAHPQDQHSPPLLVHCSAGVGRTGTYIALDIMLQQFPKTKTVNVYECVRNMRAKRLFMVQTLAQYVFIHDALDELILCGETAFNVQNLRVKITRMGKVIPGKSVTGFQEQFKLLDLFCRKVSEAQCTDAFSEHNVQKNRYKDMVPFNDASVHLKPTTKILGSNYINASFVDGYKARNAFIATQCPLKNTVNDFWRMIWEFKSSAIVMLCSEEHDKQDFYKYWPDGDGKYDKITVQRKSEEEKEGFVTRKFTVTGEQVIATVVPINVTLFHFTEWPDDEKAMNTKALLKVIKELLIVQQNTGNKAITVMCNNGCGRTGAFISIYVTLERIKTDGTVDIFQVVKSSRLRRTKLVANCEQYVYCHEVVAEFLEDFDTYANFK